MGVLELVALLWIASPLGWISGGSSFAGAGGFTFGASAGDATAGIGGGGESSVVSVGPSGLINGGIGAGGSASSDNAGCFLGFICANVHARNNDDPVDASVDDEGVDTDVDN